MKKLFFVSMVFIFPLFAIAAEGSDEVSALPCFGMDSAACEAFHLTNAERAESGQEPMQFCGECFVMAQDHSDHMVANGYFSHRRPNGETFMQRAGRFGLKNWVGENIAMNRSAANAVFRLMKSPGHRKNILNLRYDSFAVGHRDGIYTQVFWDRPQPKEPTE